MVASCIHEVVTGSYRYTTLTDATLAQLGRTLWRRRDGVLAYFDVGVSNGPVEAINGRLEHLRGIALGFKNLNHYILRCLIHSGQIHNRINAL